MTDGSTSALPTHGETADAAPAPRLAGDLAVWLIILAELLAFGILFLAFAVSRVRHPDVFAASQPALDTSAGLANTVLLITGSWCVAHAVQAAEHRRRPATLRWLLAAQGCGAAFVVLKLSEYADKAAAGIDLETNVFYMFYFFLTGFHFLHVLAAMVFLAFLTVSVWRCRLVDGQRHALETGAAFWHMVDLLWIVLFPLVYIVR
jgi:nitric oxide reductase NorE protein